MSQRQSIIERMKHLMMVVAGVASMALMLGSCQHDDVLVDDPFVSENDNYAIGFDNTFIDHAFATRTGASVALSDYVTTMGVWGWRSDNTITDQAQFDDHLVTYNSETAKWQYSPLRYWEPNSTYRFYAYAPHQSEASDDVAVTIDSSTGHISIDGVVLTGTNIQNTPTTAQQYVFSAAAGDIDWMIARAGKTNLSGRLRQTVEFTMQHILSKMNAAVRINDVLAADNDLTAVVVNSLTIGSFVAEGNFTQTLDHTPDATLAADRAAGEWTLTGEPALTLSSAEDAVVRQLSDDPEEEITGNTYLYIMESLVLPQDVTDTQTLKLCYTLTFSDGRSERYTHVMPLADAFGPEKDAGGQFLSGYSYTLYFTIGPDVITFDSHVDDWLKP